MMVGYELARLRSYQPLDGGTLFLWLAKTCVPQCDIYWVGDGNDKSFSLNHERHQQPRINTKFTTETPMGV